MSFRFNPLFLLFLALAVLVALNGIRMLFQGAQVRQGQRVTGPGAYVVCLVYLAAAIGIAAAGYYLFQF
jgi:hypothetical protein